MEIEKERKRGHNCTAIKADISYRNQLKRLKKQCILAVTVHGRG